MVREKLKIYTISSMYSKLIQTTLLSRTNEPTIYNSDVAKIRGCFQAIPSKRYFEMTARIICRANKS